MSKTNVERFIDTSNIKKCEVQYDWANSIGAECKFRYGDIYGVAIITGATPKKVCFSIDGKEYEMFKSQFLRAGFETILTDVQEYDFGIGDIIKNIKITSKTRICTEHHTYRAYSGICTVCGDEDVYLEDSLRRRNTVCKVCNGRKVKVGVNDIATTDNWMVQYMADKSDAHRYTSSSRERITTKCPICGAEKSMMIFDLKNRGHNSCKCSNKGYYSERFFGTMLDQLGIKYLTQLTSHTFEWVGKFRYDFYFEHNGETFIVETNGIQHYEKCNFQYFDLDKIQENDKKKEELAIKYVDHYIQLDCRKSNMRYVKDAVMNSQLPRLLCFDEPDIDWHACFSVGRENLWNRKAVSV